MASSLLNRSAVREFILDMLKRRRGHPFTRVALCTYDAAEGELRSWILRQIDHAPARGKTFEVQIQA